jgi:hypothetical protein
MRWDGYGGSYLLHIVRISFRVVYYQEIIRLDNEFAYALSPDIKMGSFGIGLHFFNNALNLGTNYPDAL